MDTKDTALSAKLRGLFGIEAEERLQVITSTLLTLEQHPTAEAQTDLVETLFREVHTLKGAARAVSLTEIETISQAVEHVCAGWKRKTMAVRPELFDVMLRAMDVVRQLSLEPEQVAAQQIAEVMAALAQADSPIQQAQSTTVEPPVTALPQVEERVPVVQPTPPEPSQPSPSASASSDPQEALLAKLRGLFGIEAEERLQVITNTLLALEQHPTAEAQTDLVETLFREVHTLKGAARAVSLTEIETISQAVEHVCAGWKRKTMAVRPDLFDTMLRAMDVVRQLSMEPEQVAAQQIAEVMTALAQADSPIQQAQPTPSTPAPEIDEPSEPIVEPKVTAHPAQEECAPESQPLHEQLSTQEQPQAPLSTEASSEQVSANVTEFAAGTKAKRTQGASSTSRRTATRSPRTAKKKAATEPATERVIVQPVDTSTTQIAAVQEQSSASLLVDTPPQPERTPAQPERSDAQALTVHKLEARAQAKEAGAQGRKKKGGSAPTETVRIETAKLDALFLQAEEMLTVKLKTGAYAAELRGMTTMLSAWKREWLKVHLHVRKAQSLLERLENRDSTDPVYIQTAKLVHFLNWTHEHFRAVDKTLAKMTKTIAKDQQSLGSMVDILLDDAKKILLLPFSSALEALPRMVRDLSRAQGKEIDFSMHGEAVEIDKRILEAIKDPLVHLLRNCVDHGIERPAEREQWNKSPRGTLTIAVSPSDGNTVEIVVTDDGGGINVDKVKTAAVSCGVLSQEEAAQLPDHEAIGLIFQSAVSTSDVVSDISGRGLGMTIVREKIEKLGGSITVATQLHHGTTFRIRLPLTLATFRGILIQVAGQSFIAPTANVERVVRFKQSSTVQSADGKETLSLAGYTLPFVRLHRALGLASPASTANNERFQLALVVGQDDQQIAFGIDAAVDEQEVLFKNLGPQLVRVRNIAGATVLGSGQIVAILNMSDLLTAVNNSTLAPTQSRQEAPKVEVQKKKILVAEDSITSRMLLKEILESAGYTVSTAIDGEDAFSTLQDGAFDLVVSDVEMPRVDGFSLTGKIRGDGRYTQLPVVLVTGLESQGDRERGVAVGASAYVVKGSFDQSNLLETIRRLI